MIYHSKCKDDLRYFVTAFLFVSPGSTPLTARQAASDCSMGGDRSILQFSAFSSVPSNFVFSPISVCSGPRNDVPHSLYRPARFFVLAISSVPMSGYTS